MPRDKTTTPDRRKKKGLVVSARHSFHHPYTLSPDLTPQGSLERSCHLEDNHAATPERPQKATTCSYCRNTGHYVKRCPRGHHSMIAHQSGQLQSCHQELHPCIPVGMFSTLPAPPDNMQQPTRHITFTASTVEKKSTSPIDVSRRSKTRKSKVPFSTTQDTMRTDVPNEILKHQQGMPSSPTSTPAKKNLSRAPARSKLCLLKFYQTRKLRQMLYALNVAR